MKNRSAISSLEILEARIAPAEIATVALSTLDGANGFKLSGAADSNFAGQSVSGAGDVNGDGFADVIAGALGAAEGGNKRGASYVVFGRGIADVTVSATWTLRVICEAANEAGSGEPSATGEISLQA